MLDLPITRDAFIWACSIACQIAKVPLTTNRILQKHLPPFTLGTFREAAQNSGLPVRQKAVPVSQLEKLPLPCLVTLLPPADAGPGSTCCTPAPSGATREYHIALLMKADNRSFEIAEVCGGESCSMTREAFERRFAGEVLLLGRPPVVTGDTAGLASGQEDKPARPGREPRLAWFAATFPWIRALVGGR